MAITHAIATRSSEKRRHWRQVSAEIHVYTVEYRELASWDNAVEGVNYTRAVVDVHENGIYLGELRPAH
ncbi:MAG: hypothetical protein IPO22_13600 [Anaerolineales bacterium]|nr:hypothetical protein [Anaerolineales bacterium]